MRTEDTMTPSTAPGRPPESARLVTETALLRAIARLQAETGFPPTAVALADEFGVTPTSIAYHARKMQTKGLVLLRKNRAGIAIAPDGIKTLTDACLNLTSATESI